MHKTTTNLEEALAGGYIGEVPIISSTVAAAVRFLLTGTMLWQGTVYYFGERNTELDRKFGYGKH